MCYTNTGVKPGDGQSPLLLNTVIEDSEENEE